MGKIDLYLQSLGKAFSTTGEIAPWPIHVSIPSIYGSDVEAADLFSKMKKITQEDPSGKLLSKLMIAPSVAKALLMDLIVGLKVAKPKLNLEERVWFVEEYLNAIHYLQAGDIFCLNGSNRVLRPPAAQELFDQTPWIWKDDAGGRTSLIPSFYRVSAATKTLIWSLFFYGWDDVGYEIQGPYEVKRPDGRETNLVVADFFDLTPSPLWPNMMSFPINSIKFFALYPDEAEVKIDMFCHLTNRGRLPELVEGAYLEVNGLPLRQQDMIEKVVKVLLKQVSRQQKKIEQMSKKEIIVKYIESRYYAFRRWRLYFNEDWRPPKEVLERIDKWGIINIPPGKGPSWAELRKAFDPRTDYVPGPTES